MLSRLRLRDHFTTKADSEKSSRDPKICASTGTEGLLGVVDPLDLADQKVDV
jgi:hypothetical protein